MALSQFIKDLLYLNDKIIIPGFGGFVAQYVPAQINSDKHILNPPSKHFIFDATLTGEDGVLASFISKKKSVSMDEATQLVKEMVSDFWKKLNEGGTILIEDVGFFVLDDNKVIRFKRDEERNYNSESFGLDHVVLKSAVQQNHDVQDTLFPVRKKTNFVKILIIFLLINILGAFSAFIYWKYDDIKTFFRHSSEKKNVTPVLDSVNHHVNTDTTELGQYIDTTTNIKNALRYEEKPRYDSAGATNKTDNNAKTNVSFYIIAGSFQTFHKAEMHSKYLSKQGFKPEIIQFGQDLYRISVGEYKSKDDALKQLELIKCRKGAENAWLLLK